MAFFRQELAIDLGTANTVVFKDDKVILDEPSIIAIDTHAEKRIALGNEAQLMEEQTPPGITTIRPMMNGVIADYLVQSKIVRARKQVMEAIEQVERILDSLRKLR